MQGCHLVLATASVNLHSSLWPLVAVGQRGRQTGRAAGPGGGRGCRVEKEGEDRLASAISLCLPHLTSNHDDLQSIRAVASFHFPNLVQVSNLEPNLTPNQIGKAILKCGSDLARPTQDKTLFSLTALSVSPSSSNQPPTPVDSTSLFLHYDPFLSLLLPFFSTTLPTFHG